MEDDLQWKTTFDGRQPWNDENIPLKMSFDSRQPLMEDTFDGR